MVLSFKNPAIVGPAAAPAVAVVISVAGVHLSLPQSDEPAGVVNRFHGPTCSGAMGAFDSFRTDTVVLSLRISPSSKIAHVSTGRRFADSSLQ